MHPARDLGAGSCGVWNRRQALAVVSSGTIQSLLRRGIWQQVLSGVYADGGYLLDPVQLGFAAVLSSSDGDPQHAVAGLRNAARAWDLPLIDDHDPATEATEWSQQDVLVWRRMDSSIDADCAHQLKRYRLASRADVVQHPSGLWLTSPLRTVLDCAAVLNLEAAVCLLDAALHRQLFTTARLQQAALARPRGPGSRRMRTAVELADARAESPAESLGRLLLLPAIPNLKPQVRIRNGRGRVVARADLADEAARLAVETDGKRYHAGEQMVAKDRARDRRTEALGWSTERITWHELRCQQEALLARVVGVHQRLLRRAA